MDPKERTLVVSTIQENLLSVVGASGNPEKLVKVTTDIVQGTKRLIGTKDMPEELAKRATDILSTFIKSAYVIAKNPRGVDSKSIQEFSTNRKAVEKIVSELDSWHTNASRRSSPVMELNEVIEAITKPQDNRRTSPESPDESEREKSLKWELQRKRDTLLMKMDPQTNPPHVRDVGEVLTIAVKGLMRGADELCKCSDSKLPTKEILLEPMILITDMVCKLLDVVDNLFVSKYPMRSQVYSFCSALIDNVLAYGYRTKSDNVTSLRSIATQTPALLNAAKVMVEQCEKRSNSIQESREMSIRRVNEIELMDNKEVVEVKRKAPPEPPVPKPEVKTEFEICCNVCTSVAVDQKTQQPISRGTELNLMVLATTTVREVKQDLASRIGLPFEHIQFNQGQAELPDNFVINPQNSLPYFLFNKFEPSEDELLKQRMDERKKNRVNIYDIDWSQVKGPVAVALYEYDTLGDDSNLAFDEGEVIQIICKGGDGWWDGQIGDRCGAFPASFVEEITSKEEGIRLLNLMKQGKPSSNTGGGEDGNFPARQTSEISVHPPSANLMSKFKKRGLSNPDLTAQLQSAEKNRVSGLFKKRNKPKHNQLISFDEENEDKPESPEQVRKPEPKQLSKPKVSKSLSVGGSSRTTKNESPIPPTSSSPKPEPAKQHKRTDPQNNGSKGGKPDAAVPKKRQPPPRPPPFASTHPAQAAKLGKIIRAQTTEDTELEKVGDPNDIVSTASPVPTAKPKESDSMEDLLKNLQEFDECTTSEHSYATLSDVQTYDIGDYEVISPPVIEDQPHEVVTIKISDYKPDDFQDNEDSVDEELKEIEADDDDDTSNKVVDGVLFAEDDQWNPREWRPSPEPGPVRRPPRLKKPSYSVDVDSRSGKTKASFPGSHVVGVTSSPMLTAKAPHTKAPSPQLSRNTPSPKFLIGDAPLKQTSFDLHDASRPTPTVMSKPKKSPSHSPQLQNKQDKLPAKKTPPPVPPPRQKRKPNEGTDGVPSRIAPPPPPSKPNKVSSSRSDMDLRGSTNQPSQFGQRRLTVSQQRELLRHKQPSRSRSPVVQRKTRAVMGDETHLAMSGIPENGQVYTGIGKEGILLKESSESNTTEWKPRFFQIVEDGLLYYESLESPSRVSRPLGELPLNRMVKAIPVGEKNNLHCFAILMRYETSIVLGCHSHMELEDWLYSLNDVIETNRLQSHSPSYMPSIKAAEYCLEYLLNCPMTLDKSIFKLSGDIGIIKGWLQQIDSGVEADLSFLSSPSSALCMLKSLFSEEGKLSHLVPAGIAKEISQQVKKSSPVRDIQSKLHHIPDESLHILQMFLMLFSKILEQKPSNKKYTLEVSDLNRMFGAALFEGLKSNHSLTLMAYLISTHELIF